MQVTILGDYRPWLLCAADDTRAALTGVCFELVSRDGLEGTLSATATDSHALVTVPARVQFESEEEAAAFRPVLLPSSFFPSGRWPCDTWFLAIEKHGARAWRAAPKGGSVHCDEIGARFPNWRRVVGPAFSALGARAENALGPWQAVNPSLLAKVARALGWGDKPCPWLLGAPDKAGEHSCHPWILVAEHEPRALALVMPGRLPVFENVTERLYAARDYFAPSVTAGIPEVETEPAPAPEPKKARAKKEAPAPEEPEPAYRRVCSYPAGPHALHCILKNDEPASAPSPDVRACAACRDEDDTTMTPLACARCEEPVCPDHDDNQLCPTCADEVRPTLPAPAPEPEGVKPSWLYAYTAADLGGNARQSTGRF